MTADVKGNPVEIDSLVQGFRGTTKQPAFARVYAISPFGWVAALEVDSGKQTVMYPGRFLVRDKPRPMSQRKDVPDRLRR